jgi:hypothetical protein
MADKDYNAFHCPKTAMAVPCDVQKMIVLRSTSGLSFITEASSSSNQVGRSLNRSSTDACKHWLHQVYRERGRPGSAPTTMQVSRA